MIIDNNARNSIHSFGRTSFDNKSIISDRKASAAKLHSLPFEAPITKVTFFIRQLSGLVLLIFYGSILLSCFKVEQVQGQHSLMTFVLLVSKTTNTRLILHVSRMT